MPALVADQGAEEPGQRHGGAHLLEQPLLVAQLDAGDEAADREPDGGGDRGEEEADHRPVVPRPRAARPDGVACEREHERDDGGEDAAEELVARGADGPRADEDHPERQPARHQRVREKRWTASSSSRDFSAAASGSPDASAPVDAVLDVVVEDPEREALERRRDGADLGEDVHAVAILLDHPLDPADLPLDPVQTLDERVLALVVPGLAHRTLLNRRRRSEFETTKRLEKAIAPAAIIGFSTPATASGIAATL